MDFKNMNEIFQVSRDFLCLFHGRGHSDTLISRIPQQVNGQSNV